MGIIAFKGYLVVFGGNKCWVLNAKQSSKVLAIGTNFFKNGLYHMQLKPQKLVALVMDTNSTTVAITEFWHRRLGHHHYQGLQMLSNPR